MTNTRIRSLGTFSFLLLAASPTLAQQPAGCWAGSIGTGAAERRAILELADGGGALHLLGPAVATDSIDAVTSNAEGVTVTTGMRVLRGRITDDRFAGELTRDTITQPFTLTRVSGSDPAMSLVGYWSGGLYQGETMVLHMGLEFAPAPCGQVHATMDSPDQSVENMPVTSLRVAGDSLEFGMTYLGGTFSGTADPAGTIDGTWAQGGARLSLRLTRSDSAVSFQRPQEPKPPFPYTVEEVTYTNAADGTKFAATLTLPPGDGPFPAVVLITGSGAQDRDEALMGHRPFLVIADHLTRNGIAVLRADDRGVGGSTGNTLLATMSDNAGDALAAVERLRADPRIDNARIGLVGHSEGGWVAPIAATRSDAIAFIVMLAGPAVSGEELLYAQTRAIAEASGSTPVLMEANESVARQIYGIIRNEPDSARALERIYALADTVLRTLPPEQAAALDSIWRAPGAAEQFRQGTAVTVTPWFRHLLTFDPRPVLDQVSVPALALYGELDLQVPPKQSVPVLEQLWADQPAATIHVFPGLNHLFQHAETGLIAEYGEIEETIAPEVLEMITSWILERTGRPGGR